MNSKIVTETYLKTILCKLRRNNRKIVFTNGCFDIIHVGHIRYLKKAKELGDLLVVGLNTDNSVKRLKGKNRPIIRQNDRAEILAALEYVDYVVLFNETTPERLIKDIRPDILVKGGDYKISEIVGRNTAKMTRTIPLTEGKSTSDIISKIRHEK